MKLGLVALVLGGGRAFGQSPIITNITMVGTSPRFSIESVPGMTNQIQCSTNLSGTNWLVLTNLVVTQSPYWFVDATAPTSPSRFYRVLASMPIPVNPTNMSLIPAGSFTMGDMFSEGVSDELPLHSVYVSAFYMDKYEVTKAFWDSVYKWAAKYGYSFDYPGSGKAPDHPAHSMTWYDAVKWCNARSEMENKTPAYYSDAAQTTVYRTGQVNVDNAWVKWDTGYRLPTEAEWEKAARGGASGHRFPWSNEDTITHSNANYYANPLGYSYDVNLTEGYHPTFATGALPYTSPVGYFAPNGYGLYDMAGNVWEWCWDWYGEYTSGSQTDPRGPASGSLRVYRGGGWIYYAFYCRAAHRNEVYPSYRIISHGFRTVLPPSQ